ncbi:MAG: radical SAM family heme chaperone HemW [Candidatus Margulisiibacteriota bacterium]
MPFCIEICPYCAFYKMPVDRDRMALFSNNLIQEMALYYETYGRINVNSIYFGGGTPNVLPLQWLDQIFESIHRYFKVVPGSEISMEMNPGVHSNVKLAHLVRLGINRASIGAQSFNGTVLKDYGRNHDVLDLKMFMTQVFEAGLDNVSIDIIFGHPSHGIRELSTSLNVLNNYPIKHVSLYGLTIEEGTPFYISNLTVNDDQQADEYEYIQNSLMSLNFHQYEVSNFAKSGFQSQHNIKYWTFSPTIGLGPGAHSFFQGYRYSNDHDYANYLLNLHGKLPQSNSLKMDWLEYISTRLRYISPIYFKQLEHFFGRQKIDKVRKILNKNVFNNIVYQNNEYFYIKKEGLALVDEVVCYLI